MSELVQVASQLMQQKYFDIIFFDMEDQYLGGQREEWSQLGTRNDKESCWEPCLLCKLKIYEH